MVKDLQVECALTCIYFVKSEYLVQQIEYSLTNVCPNQTIVHQVIVFWKHSALHSHSSFQSGRGQTVLKTPISSINLKKAIGTSNH